MSVEKGVSSEGAPPQPLTASTWTEIVRGSVLVVPVGSCEQHGPHLPLDTDTRIAAFLAAALCGAVDGCIVGPTVSIGASGEHAGFPGTLSFGNDVLEGMVVELGRSAIPIPAVSAPFSGVVLVNGHGGNIAAMEAAVGTLRAEGRSVLVWHPRVADGDSHAGRTETSLLLHLDPSAVRVDRLAPGATARWREIADRVTTGGLAEVSPSGVLGDPTLATASEGAAVFRALVDDLVGTVRRWRATLQP